MSSIRWSGDWGCCSSTVPYTSRSCSCVKFTISCRRFISSCLCSISRFISSCLRSSSCFSCSCFNRKRAASSLATASAELKLEVSVELDRLPFDSIENSNAQCLNEVYVGQRRHSQLSRFRFFEATLSHVYQKQFSQNVVSASPPSNPFFSLYLVLEATIALTPNIRCETRKNAFNPLRTTTI